MFGNKINYLTVSDTFQSLLRTLCLDEYPCKKLEEKKVRV